MVLSPIPAACALVVLFATIEFRTTRTFSDGSSDGLGAGHWAASNFLAAILTLGVLCASLVAGYARRAAFSALSATAFGAATFRAGAHRLRLLEERDAPRDHELSIAYGLPIATVAGAIASFLALLLILLWLKAAIGEAQSPWRRGQPRDCPDRRPRSRRRHAGPAARPPPIRAPAACAIIR